MSSTPNAPRESGAVPGKVGIVGAGTMGAGIAQIALEAGHDVAMHDAAIGAVERARARIEEGLRRRASKRGLEGRASNEWVDERLGRLRGVSDLGRLADGATLVIEAIVEDLALKRAVFGTLDLMARDDVILATNTSALSVATIARATSNPGRVLGLHFFNPAPVMALVEVVVAPGTSANTARWAEALMGAWGKTAVRSADVPGFIVNRVNRPFTLEPLRMLEAGVASVPEVDEAVRAAGFPQGPFEHIDLVGLDVNLASSRAIHDALLRPARLVPSPLEGHLVADGRLGRKTMAGFYEYDDAGRQLRPSPEFTRRHSRTGMSPSAIADRVRLALANEAFFALGDGVANEDRIDLALRLGAAHPEGPIAWAQTRGVDRVLDELVKLRRLEDARFDPAPTLAREAAGR